jgi:hypothetical protein
VAGGVEACRGGVNGEWAGRIADLGGMELRVILGVGAVMTAWVMLSLLSSERKRRVVEWEASQPQKPKTAEDEGKAEKKK